MPSPDSPDIAVRAIPPDGDDPAGPDLHLEAGPAGDAPLARCSLWWRRAPRPDAGVLGRYHADPSRPLASPAAARLLATAAQELRARGCREAIGPMDGDTWHAYRFVTGGDGSPPFLLEPGNPAEWPEQFRQAGWRPLATYTSSEIDLDGLPRDTPPALRRVASRLHRGGITIRALGDGRPYPDELAAIHAVSLASFAGNFLYTPLTLEAFVRLHGRIEPLVDGDFCRIAEDRTGRPVGFVFALADPGRTGTLIVKTLAVLPEPGLAGLGSLLTEKVHRAARKRGLDRAIHALQHETNTSLKISDRYRARVFREYTLFRTSLHPAAT